MQFRDSILPLFFAKLESGRLPSSGEKIRYAGVSFHINDEGIIATCAHITKNRQEGETLLALELFGNWNFFPVLEVKEHKYFDFAIGRIARPKYKPIPIFSKKALYIGDDVMAYGMTSDGLIEGKRPIIPRLMKGHIVRLYHESVVPHARSLCEVSFPSLAGFSGAPVIFNRNKTSLAGMLFGNYESSVQVYQILEAKSGNESYKETVNRLVELGSAHSAYDIRCYLADLGIRRVSLDSRNFDPLP